MQGLGNVWEKGEEQGSIDGGGAGGKGKGKGEVAPSFGIAGEMRWQGTGCFFSGHTTVLYRQRLEHT